MIRRVALVSEHASPLGLLGGVDSGGQNVYVAQLARHLAALGCSVDIFTRRDSDRLPEIVEWVQGIRVIHVAAGPPTFVRKEELLPFMAEFTAYMARFCKCQREMYDLLHANFWMSGLAACELKQALDVPFVITFHALGRVRRLHQKDADLFSDDRFTIEDRIVAEADRIIAECPQDEEDLIRLYNADPGKISVVPGGFDPAEMSPISKPLARFALNLPPEEKVILQLGRMVPRKGVDTAVRGLARLVHDHGVPATLVVVGGESDEPDPAATPEIGRLLEIARAEKVTEHVKFVGRRGREALKYYYSAADIFVSVPWYEPFGITPVEAMACGTPVVGSDVGGIKYTVRDGETGYLVPPNDPARLGERLAHLYRHPVPRRADVGPRRAGGPGGARLRAGVAGRPAGADAGADHALPGRGRRAVRPHRHRPPGEGAGVRHAGQPEAAGAALPDVRAGRRADRAERVEPADSTARGADLLLRRGAGPGRPEGGAPGRGRGRGGGARPVAERRPHPVAQEGGAVAGGRVRAGGRPRHAAGGVRMTTAIGFFVRVMLARAYPRVVALVRQPGWLVLETALPILSVSALAFMYRATGAPEAYVGFVFLGGAMTAFWLNVLWAMGAQLYWDRDNGNLELFMASPASLMAILAGMALGGMAITLVRAAAILALGMLLFSVTFAPSSWAALVGVFLLTMLALYGLGMLFASLFLFWGRQAMHLVGLLQEPVYLLSGLNFPVKVLGTTVAGAASVLPLTAGVDALRQLLFPEAAESALMPVWAEALLLAALAAAFLALARCALARLAHRARQEGRLTVRWL